MLGPGVFGAGRTGHSSIGPEKGRPQGQRRPSVLPHGTGNTRGQRGPGHKEQELAAGEIYTADKLLQSGFQVIERGVPSLRLRSDPLHPATLRTQDATTREGGKRHTFVDWRGRNVESGDRLNEEEARRLMHFAAVEHEAGMFSDGDSRLSMESVWGSSSGIRSGEVPRHLIERPTLRALQKRGKDGRAQVTSLRYLLGGEKGADGRIIEEATFRCIKAGASAAAARKKRFRQANACARLAAWAESNGDTAFHPVPRISKAESQLESLHTYTPCHLFGKPAETRNYHLHAQKPPIPTGPARDTLNDVDVPGMDEEREKLEVPASFIFLNPRTHRLERKGATVQLAPATTPTPELDFGEVTGASGMQSSATPKTGTSRATADQLPLLTGAKSIERTAKLLEAFERCRPDAAGWLLTSDIRWTLPRDLRVQEIFGLTRKKDAERRRKGRAETGDRGRTIDADLAQQQTEACAPSFACWKDGESILAWAKDLLRNRDEPVRFTRLSQAKYEAMLRQLRRVESSLIDNERITDAPKISFDIFCRAYWRFLGDSLPDAVSFEDEAFAIAVEKKSPYMLTPMQMLVRDALLGTRISSYELRLPDYVECGLLPLMERPDLTLAEEGETLLLQPDERRLLREQLGKREDASSFEKMYSHVLQLENQLAEHEVLKKSLGKYSRMRFLSLSAQELEKQAACANPHADDESCTAPEEAILASVSGRLRALHS